MNNKKILTVKEYDSITYKKEYENNNCKIIENGDAEKSKKTFEEFIKFIHEFSADKNNVDALELMSITYKRGLEDVIKIKNYVGIIELNNGFQIEILPKVLLSTTEDEEKNKKKTREIFLKMLRALKNTDSKMFNNAKLNYSKMNIYEIFISIYIGEASNLIKKGLKSSYISKEDNLNTIKGKLILKEQFNHNLLHKERMYCRYEEYIQNRSENKIIKATLLKLMKVSNSAENIKQINKILPYFELVTPSTNYEYDFSKITITRDMKDYEFLINWSKVFLKNKSFSTFSGSTNSKALLFKMDKLFEAYVAKMIKKYSNDNWIVKTQEQQMHLFEEPTKKFKIKPDIIIEKENGTKIILDTKWKELIPDESKKYNISQPDMYQMFAYSKKYNTPYIWLLYPITAEMKKFSSEKEIYFKSTTEDSNVIVKVFFIDLENIENNIQELIRKIEEQKVS